MVAKHYQPIDIHAKQPDAWPDIIPRLTGEEAERAARRLWRFALGETYDGKVRVASGNRYNWFRHGELVVNPGRGWRALVHDLSHYFVSRENPAMRSHSKFHAKFEAKLIREVLRRGWLEGKLKTPEKPAPTLQDKRRHELELIEAGIDRWQKKLTRAERAIAKLRKRQRYYEKALDA